MTTIPEERAERPDIAELRKLLAEATAGPWIEGTGKGIFAGKLPMTHIAEYLFSRDDMLLSIAAVNALPALLDIAERAQPAEEVEVRAASLEVYADGVFKLASKSKDDDGWLGGLAIGLRDTAAMLRTLSRHPPDEAMRRAVEVFHQELGGREKTESVMVQAVEVFSPAQEEGKHGSRWTGNPS